MQCAIDGCKRLYAVDVNDEIKRIRAQECMNKEKDFPKFMKYTHKIPVTKNGNERPYEEIKKDRNKVAKRIDDEIICPMNWMQECLDKIQGMTRIERLNILNFLVEKPKAHASHKQMSKIRRIIEDLDAFTRYYTFSDNLDYEEDNDNESLLINKSEEIYEAVSKMKIMFPTMYRLIETTFGYDSRARNDTKYKKATKYAIKTLNVLYRANKDLFLSCFIRK